MSDNQQQFLQINLSSNVQQQQQSFVSASTSDSNVPCSINTEIQHSRYLSENIGSLYLNGDFSDITLIVAGERLSAHKVILAARSDYFRALLFGGLRESSQNEIELKDENITLAAFKFLLHYVYTGRLNLARLKDDMILDVLGLAHSLGFDLLESAIIDYLQLILNDKNLCQILAAAQLYSLHKLLNHCLSYADRNADRLLSNLESFCQLPAASVCQLISRDSFCAKEIDIFLALHRWALHNNFLQYNNHASGDAADPAVEEAGTSTGVCRRPSSSVRSPPPLADDWRQILGHVRWSLISLQALLDVVRPTGLIDPDLILDAIKEQNAKRGSDLPYRGFSLPNVNVAAVDMGAQVLEGELKQSLLNGDSVNYDMERGFTRHCIEETNAGIIVQFGAPYIINNVRLLLWDKDPRSYSYVVDVSVNMQDWVRVIDYSRYLCRSWQNLHFPARVVRYVRVIGVHNTVNKVFHLVTLEAYLTTEKVEILPELNVVVPHENVAKVEKRCVVVEGVSRSPHALINGDTTHYDWDSGYTCHQIGHLGIVVQFPQPYAFVGPTASNARLLLWDLDDRIYSYTVETSVDNRKWRMVCDRSQASCKSWQTIQLNDDSDEPVIATFVRITGTRNTANEVFHCVAFVCPAPLSNDENNVDFYGVSVQTENHGNNGIV